MVLSTSSPSTRCRTISVVPAERVATTGTPQAIASTSTLPNPSYRDVSAKTSARGDVLPRIGLKSAERDRILQPACGDKVADPVLLAALPEDEQPHRHARAQQRQRFDQQRVILGFREPAGGHDHRPPPCRRVRRFGRFLCRGGNRFEINRVVHDTDARPGYPEGGDQVVGDTLRRGDDQIGRRISRARDEREDAAMPAATPWIVAVGEKRGHRRLLIEDDARTDPAALTALSTVK